MSHCCSEGSFTKSQLAKIREMLWLGTYLSKQFDIEMKSSFVSFSGISSWKSLVNQLCCYLSPTSFSFLASALVACSSHIRIFKNLRRRMDWCFTSSACIISSCLSLQSTATWTSVSIALSQNWLILIWKLMLTLLHGIWYFDHWKRLPKFDIRSREKGSFIPNAQRARRIVLCSDCLKPRVLPRQIMWLLEDFWRSEHIEQTLLDTEYIHICGYNNGNNVLEANHFCHF